MFAGEGEWRANGDRSGGWLTSSMEGDFVTSQHIWVTPPATDLSAHLRYTSQWYLSLIRDSLLNYAIAIDEGCIGSQNPEPRIR